MSASQLPTPSTRENIDNFISRCNEKFTQETEDLHQVKIRSICVLADTLRAYGGIQKRKIMIKYQNNHKINILCQNLGLPTINEKTGDFGDGFHIIFKRRFKAIICGRLFKAIVKWQDPNT